MNAISPQSALNNVTVPFDALASQPWITHDDLIQDIERLIGILVSPHVDVSNPLMHDDELRAECRAKFAQILHQGHLNKCPTRAKAFGFVKTALQHHLRSLVQKYVFTEKRTGVKPPPKQFKSLNGWFNSQPTKALHIRLDDEENLVQIGGLDPAFSEMEFLEELDRVLTSEERDILQHLVQERGDGAKSRDSVIPEIRFKPLMASLRSKARAILHQTAGLDDTEVLASTVKTLRTQKPRVCKAEHPRNKAKQKVRKMRMQLESHYSPVRLPALRKSPANSRMTRSRRNKKRKTHVISFRLTQVEMQQLRQRYGDQKSVGRAARRIVIKVLSI